jgi:alkaline phosphatase D
MLRRRRLAMDSTARHILSLARRGLLRGAAGLAALAAVQPPATGPARGQPALRQGVFNLGVASGDPWPDGAVLWTRLAPEPLAPLEVRWEVAEDERFTRMAAQGSEWARPEWGFSVHAEVAGLRPDRPYFYRFRCGAEASPVGRTRTAPAPDAANPRLRFVNAGCQMYEHGHYTAWRHVAAEPELGFVFLYGDYIYEDAGLRVGQRGWGGDTVRGYAGGETLTLEDYRQRYAQTHADPDLMAAHQAHPFLCSFDDHEVQNNWAGPISQDDGGRRHPILVPPEVFALRKQAAFQAWWENMPVRRALLPRGPEITAHRRLRFGTLAELHVLDTRSFRDDQPCGDGFNVPACAAVARPDAQMLGAAQEDWLLRGLSASPATWQVLAQQVMMLPLALPNGLNMDSWDGYPAARARLLRGLHERRIGNAVVLTGDVHSAYAGTLHLDPGDPSTPAVAAEFVGTSITSAGDGAEQRPGIAPTLARNPHIAFHNHRRGYTLHEATPARQTATFRAVDYVSRPGAPLVDKGRFVVEAGRPGVTPA